MASSTTVLTISTQLICFNKQIDLLIIQHPTVSPHHFWELLSDSHLSTFKHCLTGTFSYVSAVSLAPFSKSTLSEGHLPLCDMHTCTHACNHAIFSHFWVPFVTGCHWCGWPPTFLRTPVSLMTDTFPHLSTVSLAPFLMWALSHWHFFKINTVLGAPSLMWHTHIHTYNHAIFSHFWVPFVNKIWIDPTWLASWGQIKFG